MGLSNGAHHWIQGILESLDPGYCGQLWVRHFNLLGWSWRKMYVWRYPVGCRNRGGKLPKLARKFRHLLTVCLAKVRNYVKTIFWGFSQLLTQSAVSHTHHIPWSRYVIFTISCNMDHTGPMGFARARASSFKSHMDPTLASPLLAYCEVKRTVSTVTHGNPIWDLRGLAHCACGWT